MEIEDVKPHKPMTAKEAAGLGIFFSVGLGAMCLISHIAEYFEKKDKSR